jgi:hypothetical protein
LKNLASLRDSALTKDEWLLHWDRAREFVTQDEDLWKLPLGQENWFRITPPNGGYTYNFLTWKTEECFEKMDQIFDYGLWDRRLGYPLDFTGYIRPSGMVDPKDTHWTNNGKIPELDVSVLKGGTLLQDMCYGGFAPKMDAKILKYFGQFDDCPTYMLHYSK